MEHQFGCFDLVDGVSVKYSPLPGIAIWVVFFVFLVAFVRWLEVRNGRHGPVSIQLETFTDADASPSRESDADSMPSARAEASAAMIRRVLASYVQAPPSVPGGESILSVPTVLNEISPSDGNAITKFLALAWQTAFPARGWKLSGTIEPGPKIEDILEVRSRHIAQQTRVQLGAVGITVQVSELAGNRSIEQHTYWRDNFEEASYAAAYGLAQLALGNSDRLPEWAKWKSSTGRGLRFYRDGIEYARLGKPDEAASQLRQAITADPGNALAKAEYALALEGSRTEKGYLDALAIYLDLCDDYEEMLQPLYRAVIVMDQVSEWLVEWKKTENADIRKRIETALTEGCPPTQTDKQVRAFFLAQSDKLLQRLRSEMSYMSLLKRWLPLRGRTLYGEFVKPRSAVRKFAKTAIEVSICARGLNEFLNDNDFLDEEPLPSLKVLRKNPKFLRIETNLDDILKRRFMQRVYRRGPQRSRSIQVGDVDAMGNSAISGLPAYNAACFYARLVGGQNIGTDWEAESEEAASRAVGHLEQSVQISELREGWLEVLERDPDFKNLKEHSTFKDWLLKRLESATP
ncbi:hypothetical protein [Streptomyces sp. NPDC020681]|uniref:hypothetical protein n=1 Tax=Streptomyces sp. NPDC020681 TaxID=3365083 RepID=UPI003794E294